MTNESKRLVLLPYTLIFTKPRANNSIMQPSIIIIINGLQIKNPWTFT